MVGMPKTPSEIPRGEKLRNTEKGATNVTWPRVIDERVQGLVDLAIEAGEADTLGKGELIAAVVLAAPCDGDALRNLLTEYRKATVGRAVEGLSAIDGDADVVRLGGRRP